MLIKIGKDFEFVNDLHDVSAVIREYYNKELADKLDELISEVETNNKEYVAGLEDTIDAIRSLVW